MAVLSFLPVVCVCCCIHADRQIADKFGRSIFSEFTRSHAVSGRQATLQMIFADSDLLQGLYDTVSGLYVRKYTYRAPSVDRIVPGKQGDV